MSVEWFSLLSDADLLAFRRAVEQAYPTTYKFDPDQPRDDHGKWTSDGVDQREAAERRSGSDNDVRAIAFLWSGGGMYGQSGSTDIRLALREGLGSVPVGVSQDAAVLANAVASAQPVDYPLYRGIGLNEASYGGFAQDIKPGATIDMNLCSWSKSQDVAYSFARGAWGDTADAHQVIFQLDPGAKAYDATYDIAQGPEFTEHLSDGRFLIDSVFHDFNPDNPRQTIDVVSLRQAAVFTQPEQFLGLKSAVAGVPWSEAHFLPWLEGALDEKPRTAAKGFNPDQPRDEHGRWTSDGAADTAVGTGSAAPGARRWADVKAMKAEWKAAHPDTVLVLGAATKMKVPAVMAAMDTLDKLMTRFPQVTITAVVIGKVDPTLPNARSTMALTYPGWPVGTSRFVLSDTYWTKDGGKDIPNDSIGFHPPGTDNPEGVMTHEFGHAVWNWMTMGGAPPVYASLARDILDTNPPVSGYARTNTKEAWAETFAQAFAPGSSESTYASVAVMDLFPATKSFNPDQPRDERGRWSSDGGGDYAYHSGDLQFGRDTALGRMTPGRNTGHFGTGVYFASDPSRISGREDRPTHRVDLSGYHLYKPADAGAGMRLHDGLRQVNDAVHAEKPDTAQIASHLAPLLGMAPGDLQVHVNSAIIAARAEYNSAFWQAPTRYTDSASTRLMRTLGYDGVDVRHIPGMDNTQYGTVVYAPSVATKGYNPDEPRDDSGRWSSDGGGGGVHVPTITLPHEDWSLDPSVRHLSDGEVRAVAQRVREYSDRFKSAGGFVRGASDDREELQRNIGNLVRAGVVDRSSRGGQFADYALAEPMVNVALTPQGDVAGAHGFSEETTDYQDLLGSEKTLGSGIIGSTGIMEGAGSALVESYMRSAAGLGMGIEIHPVPDAIPYWTNMGMREIAPGESELDLPTWGMSVADVQRVVALL